MYEEVNKIYANACQVLDSVLKEGQRIELFDFSKDDWYEDESYYELPNQFLYGKYNYANLYYLHAVYKEDGKTYIKGRENEEGDEYDFCSADINVGDLTYLVDMILENLNLPFPKQVVHMGIVNHKYGTNSYASLTEAGLEKQVADFCREWWDDFASLAGIEVPEKDDEVIHAYFDSEAAGGWESYEASTTELE